MIVFIRYYCTDFQEIKVSQLKININIFPIFELFLNQIGKSVCKNDTAFLLLVAYAMTMIISMRYYCTEFQKIKVN